MIKTKFMLLDQGRLEEALDLDRAVDAAAYTARVSQLGGPTDIAVASAIDQLLRDKQQQSTAASESARHRDSSSLHRATRRELVKQLLATCMGRKSEYIKARYDTIS